MFYLFNSNNYQEYKTEFYRRPHCATCNCNAGNGCKGKKSNGVKWYRVKGDPGTWGFANENSTINLWNTDVYRDQFDDNAKDNNKDNQRLSLNVGQGSFQGASRCGNKVASFNHGEKCDAGVRILTIIHNNEIEI